MAKFYVQSGNFRTTVSAQDAEKAALWVIHRVMSQIMPVYDDAELRPEQKGHAALANGLMVLGNEIRLSEVGFDGSDHIEFDMFDMLMHWHQLMIAVSRLESLIGNPLEYQHTSNDSSDCSMAL